MPSWAFLLWVFLYFFAGRDWEDSEQEKSEDCVKTMPWDSKLGFGGRSGLLKDQTRLPVRDLLLHAFTGIHLLHAGRKLGWQLRGLVSSLLSEVLHKSREPFQVHKGVLSNAELGSRSSRAPLERGSNVVYVNNQLPPKLEDLQEFRARQQELQERGARQEGSHAPLEKGYNDVM